MQLEYNDGTFSKPVHVANFEKQLTEALERKDVKEVRVFAGTDANIRDAWMRREKSIKLKAKGFRKRRRYK